MFRPWLIFLAVVVSALYFWPSEWMPITSAQQNSEDIEAATLQMMPADVGIYVGQAAGNAESCGYQLDENAVEIALSHSGLRPQMLEPGGASRRLWVQGYEAGLTITGAPGYCDLAYQEFGPEGTVIPHLIQR